MAQHSVQSAVHATLVLNTVDVVVFTQNWGAARITNRGTQSIFVRLDGTDPEVMGDDSYVVLAGKEKAFGIPNPESPDIRLIASLACAYSVEGA